MAKTAKITSIIKYRFKIYINYKGENGIKKQFGLKRFFILWENWHVDRRKGVATQYQEDVPDICTFMWHFVEWDCYSYRLCAFSDLLQFSLLQAIAKLKLRSPHWESKPRLQMRAALHRSIRRRTPPAASNFIKPSCRTGITFHKDCDCNYFTVKVEISIKQLLLWLFLIVYSRYNYTSVSPPYS